MNTKVSAPHRHGRVATLRANPQPVEVDLATSAVIVIDMQNDFGADGGMFQRAGIDISMIKRAVEPTRRVLEAARSAGMPVIYLKMGYKADLSDLGAVDSPNYTRHMRLGVGSVVMAPNGDESRILVRDTWSTDILPELTPKQEDFVLYKHRFSGFFETELSEVLSRLRIKYLVVTGCTTSICVESTIRDAMFRDYSCILLDDCTGEPIGYDQQRSNHDASLLTIQVLLGWTTSSEEFIRALNADSIASAASGLVS